MSSNDPASPSNPAICGSSSLTDSVSASCRLGIAVPKKLLKTAVHRNIVKRIARDVFRRIRLQLDARDYVLRLSVKLDPKRQPLDRKALAEDMRHLFFARRPASGRNPARLPTGQSSSPRPPMSEMEP